MFGKGKQKGTVRFSVRDGGVRQAEVAGDFSAWRPVAMKKQKSGEFVATIEARPGTYQYKFILDGQWAVDPDNPELAANCHGTYNSVAVVK